jgi:hypothetical protein
MKQRKESEKGFFQTTKKPASNKSIQELTNQISQIIGKDPKKTAKALEFWMNDHSKSQKKAS